MRDFTPTFGLPACALIALLLAACAPQPTPSPLPPQLASHTPPASHTPQLVSPMPTEPSTRTPPPGHAPPHEDLIVDRAVADLAKRLEVDPSAVEVIEVEAQVWPDSSLGCPRPGELYLQVETPGWRITLQALGETHDYHADERGHFVLCREGKPLQPVSTEEVQVRSEQVEQAVADLASRHDLSEDEIAVISVEEVTWRDGSLGCPQPGRSYTQALVNGSRIVLEADGRLWHYHSGGGRDPILCMNPEEPYSVDDSG